MNLDKITQRYLEIFPGDFSGNPAQRQTPNFFFALTEIYGFKNIQKILENNLDSMNFDEPEPLQELPIHGNIRGKNYFN